jgi:CHAT domain-containing protein
MLQYDRLVIRIEPGSAPDRYEVFVEGEGGEGHGRFDLPFRALDIENFVLRMSRGRGTRRAGTSEANRAKAFGHELFTALFQGEVRDVYRSCVADARRQNRGLRVTLALTKVPELMDVPWEYLYDEPDFLAVSEWTPVVRYLDVARARPPLAVNPPLRVLGMISDVADMPTLDVEGERARLERALRPLRSQGRVEVHWTQAATLDCLLRKLHHGDFHVLHFVGHGAYDETREDGVLLLEGPDGRSQDITGERLGTILQDHHSLRLVVLNACEGARNSQTDPFAGVAASLVRRGIPAVVAMQFEISDDAALTFAAYFYEALAQGDPVDGAVAHARLGIFASGNDVEWGTPVLFLRSTDGRAFELQGEQARSPEAALALAFEAQPTAAAVGEPITWSLHVQNVGTPSLFRATPRDHAGRPLGEPVDLMSGEDAVYTWISTAEAGPAPTVSVTASDAAGLGVRAQAQARLDVEPPEGAARASGEELLTIRASDSRGKPSSHSMEGAGGPGGGDRMPPPPPADRPTATLPPDDGAAGGGGREDPPHARPRWQRRAPVIGVLAAVACAVAVGTIVLSSSGPSSSEQPSTTAPTTTAPPGDRLDGNLAPVPTNRVQGIGTAVVRLTGTRLTASVDATRLFDGKHAMHIHAGAKGVCPTASAAHLHNGNLAISTSNGVPWYGPPVTALTTTGDTSKHSIVSFKRYKSASDIAYHRRGIRVSRVVAAEIREENAVIVVHGIDYNGNDIYDNAALDRSDIKRSLSGEITAPALCGRLLVRHPSGTGGVQTGQAPSPAGTRVFTASLNVQPAPGPRWFCPIGAPTDGDRAPA